MSYDCLGIIPKGKRFIKIIQMDDATEPVKVSRPGVSWVNLKLRPERVSQINNTEGLGAPAVSDSNPR